MRRLAKEYKPKRDKNGQFSSTGSTGGGGGGSNVTGRVLRSPDQRGSPTATARSWARHRSKQEATGGGSKPASTSAKPKAGGEKSSGIRNKYEGRTMARRAGTNLSEPHPVHGGSYSISSKGHIVHTDESGKSRYVIHRDGRVLNQKYAPPTALPKKPKTAKPTKPAAKKPTKPKAKPAPAETAIAVQPADGVDSGSLPKAKPLADAPAAYKPATAGGLVRAKPLANEAPKTAKPVKPAKQPKAPKAEKPAAVKQPKPAKPAAAAKPVKPANPEKPVRATLVKPAEKPPVIKPPVLKPQPNAYGDNGGRSLTPPQAAAKPMTMGERLGNFVRNELATISQAISGAKKPEIVDAELVSGPPAKATPAATATAKPAEKKPAVESAKPATVRAVGPGEATDKPVPRAKPLARAKPLVTAKPLPARPPRAAARVITAAKA